MIAARAYQLNAAPVSMIDKRLQRRERVDLAAMRRDTIARLREIIAAGGVATR